MSSGSLKMTRNPAIEDPSHPDAWIVKSKPKPRPVVRREPVKKQKPVVKRQKPYAPPAAPTPRRNIKRLVALILGGIPLVIALIVCAAGIIIRLIQQPVPTLISMLVIGTLVASIVAFGWAMEQEEYIS